MTHVLLVEDEPDLADPLAYLLRREGFEVEIAEDGQAALTAFRERAADIVRAAGFEPTFHHHAGTFVESPAEIDRFLANVNVEGVYCRYTDNLATFLANADSFADKRFGINIAADPDSPYGPGLLAYDAADVGRLLSVERVAYYKNIILMREWDPEVIAEW